MVVWDEFDSCSIDDWKNKIIKDLKIDSVDDITWQSSIGPIYPVAGHFSEVNSVHNQSNLCINANFEMNSTFSNSDVLYALKCGANSITLSGSVQKDFLKDVMHEIISTHVEFSSENFQEEYNCWREYKNYYSKEIYGSLRFDPIGDSTSNLDELFSRDSLKTWLSFYHNDDNYSTKTIFVDGSIYGNSFATPVQEIAYTLSHLNEYIELLKNKKSTHKIIVKLAVGNSYFIEIAKLRAIRQLISIVCDHHKLKYSIQIETIANNSRLSPNEKELNLLRLTTFSMASFIGSADILTISPDSLNSADSEKATRLAINIPIILREESHFSKVKDPCRGAYAIEQITSLIKNESFKLFKEIENFGGWIKYKQSLAPQKNCSKNTEEFLESILDKKETIIGFNKYSLNDIKLKKPVGLTTKKFSSVNLESLL